MIHGEGTRQAACEAVSLDRFDSLPALQVSQFNNGDVSSPSSRYSSCGESDFERYCSANSVLGTPSVCSTITVFNDFTEYDRSDMENFSLRDGIDITGKDQRLSSNGASSTTPLSRTGIRSDNIQTHQNLKYNSIALESYGDDNDDLPVAPMLGALGSEMSKGRNKIGAHTKSLETLSDYESDDAGTTEKYLLGDVDGKCTGIVLTVGGEDEYNGRESNLHIGKAADPNIVKPHVRDVDKLVNSPNAHRTGDAQQAKTPELDNSQVKFDLVFNSKVGLKSNLAPHPRNINAESFENLEQIVPSSSCEMRKTLDSSSTLTNLSKKSPVISKTKDFERHELYDDVHEMEEIFLDSIDSAGSRLGQGNKLLEPQLFKPLRDGGLTASTSGTDDASLPVQPPMRLDRVEVVGARQKKGDVSFSKRLVGIREYTVYKLKVWSGKEHWVIERRYRDFLTLYHCMKALFTKQNWDLPSPWYAVEKETKKIFGSASPEVIVQRSILLQECLQSILHMRLFSSPPSALIWFLSPPSALMSDSSFTSVTIKRNYSSLGKAISLVLEIPPCKSIEQMLAAQRNCCAGCHRHFDDGTTSIWDFLQTFGWGKPRLCEYTAKLLCSSCHTNETAVLPARVLHHWDFTHYPVSQLAKSYLDSINDQPLLSVTAANPILLSKVPALLHVMSVRKKIETMLPFVVCPFRRSISSALGVRRYLLENNDVFALRDLIDLSKGSFAALPGILETVSRKILKHITDQCIICCDVGVPCSARQDCCSPCSLIFPFQEDEIERCTTCQSVFHKPCFRKVLSCSCGAHLNIINGVRLVRNW